MASRRGEKESRTFPPKFIFIRLVGWPLSQLGCKYRPHNGGRTNTFLGWWTRSARLIYMYTSFFPFCTRHTKKRKCTNFPSSKKKRQRVFRYLPEIRRYYGGRGGALVISYIDSVLTLSEKVSSAMERKLFSWATVGRKSRNSRTEKKKDFSSYFSWLLEKKKKSLHWMRLTEWRRPTGGRLSSLCFSFL